MSNAEYRRITITLESMSMTRDQSDLRAQWTGRFEVGDIYLATICLKRNYTACLNRSNEKRHKAPMVFCFAWIDTRLPKSSPVSPIGMVTIIH